MASIIGTRPADNTIYELATSPLSWTPFSVQPPGGLIGAGIWGGPLRTIWAHNGQDSGDVPAAKYLFFDGSAWSEHTSPTIPSNQPPRAIHGNADGSIVYAAGNSYVHKFASGVWSAVSTAFSCNAIWCDPTGQYVWASTGSNSIWYSGDYGATWNDVWSQIPIDLDANWRVPWFDLPWVDPNSGSFFTGAVWGLDSGDVYCSISFKYAPFLTYTMASIIKHDSGGWHEVCQRVGYPLAARDYLGIGDGPPSRLGATPGMWSDGINHYAGSLSGGGVDMQAWRAIPHPSFESTTEQIVSSGDVAGFLSVPDGRCIMGLEDVAVIAADNSTSGQSAHVFFSDDGFDSYTDMTLPWATSQNGLQCLTVFGAGVGVEALQGGPITERGGHLLTAVGAFPTGEDFAITIDGEPCYGGQGFGYSPRSLDGTTIEFVSPPVALGAQKVVDIATTSGSLIASVDVIERSWGSAEHEAHRDHPPWAAVGKRILDLEDLIS
ncbi:MAG: hypothetical protein KJN79_09330 [Gammaproteobacteria bacterium]|nr:hypothetical protein [Gammaproteobacteria bacterium]